MFHSHYVTLSPAKWKLIIIVTKTAIQTVGPVLQPTCKIIIRFMDIEISTLGISADVSFVVETCHSSTHSTKPTEFQHCSMVQVSLPTNAMTMPPSPSSASFRLSISSSERTYISSNFPLRQERYVALVRLLRSEPPQRYMQATWLVGVMRMDGGFG